MSDETSQVLVNRLVNSANILTNTFRNSIDSIQQSEITNSIKLETSLMDARQSEINDLTEIRKSTGPIPNLYYQELRIEGSRHRYYPVVMNIPSDGEKYYDVDGSHIITQHVFNYKISYDSFNLMGEISLIDTGETAHRILQNVVNYRYNPTLLGPIRCGNNIASNIHIVWLRGELTYQIRRNWVTDCSVYSLDDNPVMVYNSISVDKKWDNNSNPLIWYINSLSTDDLLKIDRLYDNIYTGIGSTDSIYGKISLDKAIWNRTYEKHRYGNVTNREIYPLINRTEQVPKTNGDVRSAPIQFIDKPDLSITDMLEIPKRIPMPVACSTNYAYGTKLNNIEKISSPSDIVTKFQSSKQIGESFDHDRYLCERFSRVINPLMFPELYIEFIDFDTQSFKKIPDLINAEYTHLLDMDLIITY